MLKIEHTPVNYAIPQAPKNSVRSSQLRPPQLKSSPTCLQFPVCDYVPAQGIEICSTCHCESNEILTIESLFRLYGAHCLNCGVNWKEQHASLGCKGCGGYGMERPCPICEGKCKNIWRREVLQTRRKGKATWTGICNLNPNNYATGDTLTLTLC